MTRDKPISLHKSARSAGIFLNEIPTSTSSPKPVATAIDTYSGSTELTAVADCFLEQIATVAPSVVMRIGMSP